MNQNEATSDSHITPSETQLSAFISSVMDGKGMDPEFVVYRAEAAFACVSAQVMPWVWEGHSASSYPPPEIYLPKVRECDFFIWIVGEETSEPVRNEVMIAIDSKRSILPFLLPAEERSPDTEKLLDIVKRISTFEKLDSDSELGQAIEIAISADIVREVRDSKNFDSQFGQRNSQLERLITKSESRCKTSFLRLGVPEDLATNWSTDSMIGKPRRNLAKLRPGNVAVLTGPAGAGKSLIAERIHQSAIVRAINEFDAPLPVFANASKTISVGN